MPWASAAGGWPARAPPPAVVGDPAGCRGPAGPAVPRDRSPQPAVARGKPVRAAAVLREARHQFCREFQKSVEPYREFFDKEVIGRFDDPPLPANPRTRKSYEGPKWTGYEVVLDVLPDVFAYGVLLVPKDLKPGERRPVVVCQHGLEGRPTDVILGDKPLYHDFAARLAERGFVTFAPQNLYLFDDRFRTLQRKANPIKKTLFSIIVPQHQQIVDWLGTLPFVDRRRIAFYGLSLRRQDGDARAAAGAGYCLSICSGDFNEWVWKNASTRAPYSYVGTGEYEIFEFDLGSTFNYAEMAALIAPRPFMVERGHFDGVAPDETVGYEFAKVRFLYEAKLELVDRCRIEWFVGPHTIHGQGTFDFLHEQLAWPKGRRPCLTDGPGFAVAFALEQFHGVGVVDDLFGLGIDDELLAAEPVADVAVVDPQGAAMAFLDVGVGQLPAADALDEVLLVLRVGELALWPGP